MKHKHETWGWMLAVDFFFAGMGAGMLVIFGLAELFFGAGTTSILGNFLGVVFVGLGAGFLILELGRPLQAWRVFMNPKAILTFGAWNMVLAMGAGFLLFTFAFTFLPWSGIVVIPKILAVLCVLTGLVVATYPGILLARHKSRPFWVGPGMMVLFMLSSLVTGGAAHILSNMVYAAASSVIFAGLAWVMAGLLALQFIFWVGYIWIKYSGATEREALAAQRWISGNFATPFKGGILLFGSIIPMVFIVLPSPYFVALGALMVLFGGILMRHLVVYSGEDRTWLPGEQKYRSRLPVGDEEFIRVLK